jgi:hypothetical protein
VIVLTATPETGRTFYGWLGDCTGAGTCELQMTHARSVTAGFSHPPADVDRMVADLFGTPTLTPAEVRRLDCNASTAFDIGDLLCYIDDNPGLTLGPGVMTAILRQSGTTRPPRKAPGPPRED